ncbi:MAG: isoprenylcysteine carboxylmethyltransferase family protein [Candidatus Schekmanbacteria bacterium]|nr:isoprenylcysteine carboxylmethyltransferase family protein [Candidatus Schekmanbacteria bacterium]
MYPKSINYWLRKIRIRGAWLLLIVAVLLARQELYWPGLVLAFSGLMVRLWASGHIDKDGSLANSGPYAYTRNPLYLGSLIMALGFCWALSSYVLFALVAILFSLIYYPTMIEEEKKLFKKFGKEFKLYQKSVPRLFPNRLIPIKRSIKKFSWSQVRQNHEWRAILVFLLLCFTFDLAEDVIHPFIDQKASFPALVKDYAQLAGDRHLDKKSVKGKE